MRVRHLLLLGSLSLQCAVGWTQTRSALPVPETRQLRGLSAAEATALLVKLDDAQRGLRAGKFESFELIAGSIASYPATKVSPRDAFLQVQFAQVWDIVRDPSDGPRRQLYKLAYSPNGLGHLYWDIEVVLGFNGKIERVLMFYKPPAPY